MGREGKAGAWGKEFFLRSRSGPRAACKAQRGPEVLTQIARGQRGRGKGSNNPRGEGREHGGGFWERRANGALQRYLGQGYVGVGVEEKGQ